MTSTSAWYKFSILKISNLSSLCEGAGLQISLAQFHIPVVYVVCNNYLWFDHNGMFLMLLYGQVALS